MRREQNHPVDGAPTSPSQPASGDPALQATLAQKFQITIMTATGATKGWSKHDLEELNFALKLLSGSEQEAIKGYTFVRYDFDPGRLNPKVDGLLGGDHNGATKTINIYYLSREDQEASDRKMGVKKNDYSAMERENRHVVLHELGHAMADRDVLKANSRKEVTRSRLADATERLRAAEKARDDLEARFNAGEQTADLRRAIKTAQQEAKSALKAGQRAEQEDKAAQKAIDDAQPTENNPNGFTRAELQFDKLKLKMPAVSPYAATDASDGFAETYADFKLLDKGKSIPGMPSGLKDWFKKQGYFQ
jgi:hypothetical protein